MGAMPDLDPEIIEKLLGVLPLLGAADPDHRAKAAGAIDAFVNRLGGWDVLLQTSARRAKPRATAAVIAPTGKGADTPWRKMPRDEDGCAGMWRRCDGKILTIRECRPPVPGALRPRGSRRERFYSTVDGVPVTDLDGTPQIS